MILIKGKEDLEGFNLIIVAIFALVIGSFLNMLIYRLPNEISLINPRRSICPECGYVLKWYENIPILSYIFLNKKCSNCKKEISFFYPFVELLTTFLTILIFLKLGFCYEFFILIFLIYLLIVLSFIDLKYKEVPEYLLILSLTVTLIYIFIFKIENLEYFFLLAGAVVILENFITFYIQNIKSRLLKDESLKFQKSLGEGDIPIFAIIGGILGLKLGFVAIFLAAVFAIIPAVFNLIVKKDLQTPFIPFLSLGFISVFLYQNFFLQLLETNYKLG